MLTWLTIASIRTVTVKLAMVKLLSGEVPAGRQLADQRECPYR